MRSNSTLSTSATYIPTTDYDPIAGITKGIDELSMARANSPDTIQQLVAALTAVSVDRNTSAKAIQWPRWDGKRDNYTLFRWQIKTKITVENGKLGSNQGICANIFNGLPTDKQQRVIQWLSDRERYDDFDPESFIEHMDDRFLDREAEAKALDELNKINQGSRQLFEDFRQQFEQLMSRAGSLAPQGPSKITIMNNALNYSLQQTLKSVRLSRDDYEAYVKDVQYFATKTEALFHQRRNPPAEKETLTSQGRSHSPQTPIHDAEGDVEMTGINALSAQIAALVARFETLNKKEDKRPRAKWRPQEEFLALLQAGKCGRCKKTKHHPNVCEFRPATRPRPKAQVAAVATQPTNDDSHEASSGSEN